MALTPKQARFVREYLVDLNATQAAVRAGYSEKTARAQASRLLTNVDVAAAVAKGAGKQLAKVDVTAEHVLGGIKRIADDEGASETGRLKAYELLGKHLKLFTEKLELSGKLTYAELVEESLAKPEAK